MTARVIDVFRYPEKRQEMEARADRTSVPQIFIDGMHIGGCDQFYQLERGGRLVPLLGGHMATTEKVVDCSDEPIMIRSLPSTPVGRAQTTRSVGFAGVWFEAPEL